MRRSGSDVHDRVLHQTSTDVCFFSQRYLQLCRSLKTWGITTFNCKVTDPAKKKPVKLLLGVTRDSVLFMDPETKVRVKMIDIFSALNHSPPISLFNICVSWWCPYVCLVCVCPCVITLGNHKVVAVDEAAAVGCLCTKEIYHSRLR